MAKIEVTDDQILTSLDSLSPQARQEALRRLLAASAFWDHVVDRNRDRIRATAAERGREWDAMTEEERIELIAQIVHEK